MTLSDIDLAAQLVRKAGMPASQMLARGLETQQKTSVSDVVSAADHAAEELVAQRLIHERPDDGLVGEEGASRDGQRTWYIDPVDGTYNFLSGLPLWCSAVGLVDEEGPVLGAVYLPVLDELWLGGREHPTTCNGRPVAPLIDKPMTEMSLASYLHPSRLHNDDLSEPLEAAVSTSATVRALGSGSIELSYVAGGRLGAWLQPNTLPWDWFPGVALVTGAGGVAEVLQHRGHRWHIAGSQQAVSELTTSLLSR